MAPTISAHQQATTAVAGARACVGFGGVAMWADHSPAFAKARLLDGTTPNRVTRPRELLTT